MQLLDVGAAADFPACVQDLHEIEGWSLCPWYDPSVQSVQVLMVVANAVPAAQNLHDGLASVFWDWYLPPSHGEQVNVLVSEPTSQLRLPDPW